jgi:hypothetical protein
MIVNYVKFVLSSILWFIEVISAAFCIKDVDKLVISFEFNLRILFIVLCFCLFLRLELILLCPCNLNIAVFAFYDDIGSDDLVHLLVNAVPLLKVEQPMRLLLLPEPHLACQPI